MKKQTNTGEEIAMEQAISEHQEAIRFEQKIAFSSLVLYLIGLPLWIFGSARVEVAGLAVIVAAGLGFLYAIWLKRQSRKLGAKARALVQPYVKKKNEWMFHKIQEKFADDDTIQIKQGDDGTVTVIDTRKE